MKRFLIIIILLTTTSILSCSYQTTFSSDNINYDVTITEKRNSIIIEPSSGETSTTGLLFYPGGLVDNHAYNDLLAQFSEEAGIKCVVVKMPANLAVFAINSGIKRCEEHPDIEKWIIAGHSLGGAMAASTVNKYSDFYSGIIFMDSYPADSVSLKNWEGCVLSLFSSIEKISDEERMNKTLSLIPPATWLTEDERSYPEESSNYSVIHCINGGSHSYFGSYGPQDGDFTPTITREEFHDEVVDYMTEFFSENGWE
ncbi:MAG: alpha/beta hydrolase [Spirochaetales bacterium]|nr:alpha/beta hydrolase [Spirochaetales bacterium]